MMKYEQDRNFEKALTIAKEAGDKKMIKIYKSILNKK